MVVWLAILVKLIMTTKAEAHVYRLQVEVETLKSQIEAMKSQIEAMKCCANCEHHARLLIIHLAEYVKLLYIHELSLLKVSGNCLQVMLR